MVLFGVITVPIRRVQQSEYEDQRCSDNVSSNLCELDARTHNEMQAECHLIVKSLSSSCKHSGGVTARVRGGARGTYFCVYQFDHHHIADQQMGAVVGVHLRIWRSESR